MADLLKKNNAKSMISMSGGLTSGGLTLAVTDGSKFPTIGDFMLTIWDKFNYPDPGDDSNMEIVRATARTSNDITITRAQEGTIGVAHANGSAVELLLTAGTFSEIVIIDSNGNTPGINQHLRFNIIDPNAVVVYQASVIGIVPSLNAAITITNIKVTCEVNPTTQLDWNLKYADTLIGRANTVLIAALNTTAGVFNSGVISVIIPVGKCIFVNFDTTPAALPNEACVDITFKYN